MGASRKTVSHKADLASLPVSFVDIEAAQQRISGKVLATPFLFAPHLSDFFKASLWIKYENLQATNSFKERGALNKLLQLTTQEKKRGIIAMSAGNHAQAVAYHAQRLGIPTTIVMPETTPGVKIEATENYGAKVVLSGETYSDCRSSMKALQEKHSYVAIPAYDDVAIIAGQGTIGLEVLDAAPDLDSLVIPVGGGGLASGIAIAAKTIKPAIRIVAVESELFPSLACALKNKPFPEPKAATLAEGIAVKNIGKLNFPILRQLVDKLVLVSEADIEWAINAYLGTLKTLAEGAGAAALAALLQMRNEIKGKKVGLILSGGNIDPRLAATIMVRALEREEKIVTFRFAITDRPGTLGRITTLMGELGANILEVDHRRLLLNLSAKGAYIDITVEVRDSAHAKILFEKLKAAGHNVTRIDSGAVGF